MEYFYSIFTIRVSENKNKENVSHYNYVHKSSYGYPLLSSSVYVHFKYDTFINILLNSSFCIKGCLTDHVTYMVLATFSKNFFKHITCCWHHATNEKIFPKKYFSAQKRGFYSQWRCWDIECAGVGYEHKHYIAFVYVISGSIYRLLIL